MLSKYCQVGEGERHQPLRAQKSKANGILCGCAFISFSVDSEKKEKKREEHPLTAAGPVFAVG